MNDWIAWHMYLTSMRQFITTCFIFDRQFLHFFLSNMWVWIFGDIIPEITIDLIHIFVHDWVVTLQFDWIFIWEVLFDASIFNCNSLVWVEIWKHYNFDWRTLITYVYWPNIFKFQVRQNLLLRWFFLAIVFYEFSSVCWSIDC